MTWSQRMTWILRQDQFKKPTAFNYAGLITDAVKTNYGESGIKAIRWRKLYTNPWCLSLSTAGAFWPCFASGTLNEERAMWPVVYMTKMWMKMTMMMKGAGGWMKAEQLVLDSTCCSRRPSSSVMFSCPEREIQPPLGSRKHHLSTTHNGWHVYY